MFSNESRVLIDVPDGTGAVSLAGVGHSVPVFVVGCYRSGTTLMENVLSRHGQFATLGFETHFFTHVLRNRPLPEFNRDHWRQPLRRRFGVDTWDRVSGNRLEAYRWLMSGLAQEECRRFWVEKTPDHLFDLKRIRRCFPGAKFICMLRDGRDAVASIVHAPYILPRVVNRRCRLIAACALWDWMTAESRRLAVQGSSDFILVRYEALVQSPGEQLVRVAKFLGLGASEGETSAWLSRLNDIAANSSFGSFAGIDVTPVRRWQSQNRLTAEENALVSQMLAPTLRDAAYADLAGPVARAPVGARVMRLAWLATRCVRSTLTHGQPLLALRNLLGLACGPRAAGAATTV